MWMSNRSRRNHFLRQWRLLRELTQEELAERLEIDQATLSRIENNKVPYNQDFLEQAAFALGCEPAEILAVNPKIWDGPRLISQKLRAAPESLQRQALAVLEAMLKAG